MAENLQEYLIPSGTDDYEVLNVLERYYGSGGMEDQHRIVYPSRPDYSVRITWRRGGITRLEPGPRFRTGGRHAIASNP